MIVSVFTFGYSRINSYLCIGFVTPNANALIVNICRFRGGEIRPIGKDIITHYQIACNSGELLAICIL